jgi:hypothetical protein
MKLRDLHEGQDVIVRVNPVVYSSMQPTDPIFEEIGAEPRDPPRLQAGRFAASRAVRRHADLKRPLLTIAALLYSLLHFFFTGIRQPLANFKGDFLASFPAWKVALLCGRLDLYAGSLAQKWGPPPIWHYGPVST